MIETPIPHASPKPVGPGSISPNTFEGRGGVDVFRAITLASALRLWSETGIIPTRGVTISRMLEMAEQYVGVKYKRTRGGAAMAAYAVRAWAQDAGAALRADPKP